MGYAAYFTDKGRKVEKIDNCIFLTDTVKFLISIAWEGKLLSHKQFEDMALKLDEVGRMLGGWRKSLDNPEKKNRTL